MTTSTLTIVAIYLLFQNSLGNRNMQYIVNMVDISDQGTISLNHLRNKIAPKLEYNVTVRSS